MTNTPTATHAYNGGRRRTIALVMLVVVALVAASLRPPESTEGHPVDLAFRDRTIPESS